jgi:hypothetical protein
MFYLKISNICVIELGRRDQSWSVRRSWRSGILVYWFERAMNLLLFRTNYSESVDRMACTSEQALVLQSVILVYNHMYRVLSEIHYTLGLIGSVYCLVLLNSSLDVSDNSDRQKIRFALLTNPLFSGTSCFDLDDWWDWPYWARSKQW